MYSYKPNIYTPFPKSLSFQMNSDKALKTHCTEWKEYRRRRDKNNEKGGETAGDLLAREGRAASHLCPVGRPQAGGCMVYFCRDNLKEYICTRKNSSSFVYNLNTAAHGQQHSLQKYANDNRPQ